MDWKNSKEKESLQRDILAGRVTDLMSTRDVYDMHNGAFHKFNYQNFRTNLKNLRDSVREFQLNLKEEKYMNRGKTIDWKNSNEKALLKREIIAGKVTDLMLPGEVYNMYNGVFHKFEYKNFRINMNHLKKSIDESKLYAASDAVMLSNTIANAPIDRFNEPSWQSSKAKVSISSGFKSGYLNGKTPKQIYDSNPDYKEFDFKQFSDNFYKEKHAGKKKSYWASVKAKTEEKKERKRYTYKQKP